MKIFGRYMRRSLKTQLNINPLVTSYQSSWKIYLWLW